MELSKSIKIIITTAISIFTCFFAYRFCYFIAEKYFFDKFFYKKSSEYGYCYSIKNGSCKDRYKYIELLSSNDSLEQINNTDDYKIVIIGDSYVLGMGIKNEERFANVLEKKLNKIKPTKIISFSDTSMSPINYLNWYEQIKTRINADLYIFALVNNDAYIRPDTHGAAIDTDNIINNCQKSFPDKSPILDTSLLFFYKGLNSDNNSNLEKIAASDFENSWSNPINLCVLNTSLSKLPTSSAIYFITDDYFNNNDKYKIYKDYLIKNNKNIISSTEGKNLPKYSKYWNKDIYQKFQVSKMELHPNTLANKMYADILFQEITSNPQFNFKSN